MPGGNLLFAKRDRQQCRIPRDPPPDKLQEIRARVVGPVRIFDDDCRAVRFPQFIYEGLEQPMGRAVRIEGVQQFPPTSWAMS